jgi:hypothetical protein
VYASQLSVITPTNHPPPLRSAVVCCVAGKNLQAQYERWQPRAKYKMHLDPTMEDVKKLCVSCRRTAKVGQPPGGGEVVEVESSAGGSKWGGGRARL